MTGEILLLEIMTFEEPQLWQDPGPFIPGPGLLPASIIQNPDLSQYLKRTDVVTNLRPLEAESHGHTLSSEKTAKIENSQISGYVIASQISQIK